MPDGTVCNPAYLPDQKESILSARAFVGNGYAAFNSADQLLNQKISQAYLQTLFQQQNDTALEANIGLNFTTRYLQAIFSPYRVQYASEVHNPNEPVVAVNAALEQALVFSTGSSLIGISNAYRDFSVGLRLNILQRKFVHGSFSFLDVATKSTADYLPVRQQNSVLFDPVAAWIPVHHPWHFRVSFGVKNLGYTSDIYSEYPNQVDLVGGIGIEPPLNWGRLRIGVDFVDLIYANAPMDRARLGASYQFGLIELMTGLNTDAATLGISFLISFIQVGVVYEVAREDLQNGNQQTRIATEFGVRL